MVLFVDNQRNIFLFEEKLKASNRKLGNKKKSIRVGSRSRLSWGVLKERSMIVVLEREWENNFLEK
ncbi:Hypothetical protein Minf_0933 [Methylacidiphilum infernorum V4]|uniref:Uncharacterized protein n=1 Tax=Methylacidiphilum infernorum (isolate V4) TaxID=481448 RepID=B3DUI5_METI4|nr:Hypothetical protein Minf_0933 [Methylacidiphilum infernorum V4]